MNMNTLVKQNLFNKIRFLRERLGPNLRDRIVATLYHQAEEISNQVVRKNEGRHDLDTYIDNITTSRILGIPLMLLLLTGILWLTITGANYPSKLLSQFLFSLEDRLTAAFHYLNAPAWLHGIVVLGMYRTLAWVVSVMLPPMAIFFPLFTFLEDLGYLPRVAFNLDRFFKKAGAHGKQVLTMCMGFGCNAAGVIACRIIESPRERLVAILTNTFVPCNGRFPTLFTMAAILMGTLVTTSSNLTATLFVTGVVIFGISITLIVSWLLSKTILKGVPSSFTLELPPYRLPKIGSLIVRSVLDRTIFVLLRAVIVALPAGALTWVFANLQIDGNSLLNLVAGWLQGFARLLGLDGYIILAFILGLPANEIVLPILIMSYLSQGAMLELDSITALKDLLLNNGWTWLTALNMSLFSLLHFPCATTILTIGKETRSVKWTLLATAIPTGVAIVVCFLVTQIVHLFNLL